MRNKTNNIIKGMGGGSNSYRPGECDACAKAPGWYTMDGMNLCKRCWENPKVKQRK